MNLLFVLAIAALAALLWGDAGRLWGDLALTPFRWRPPDR